MTDKDTNTAFSAGGTNYTLRYTTNAICQLEEELDTGFDEIITQIADGSGAQGRLLRALTWAGLVSDQPKMTLHDAGEIMDKISLIDLTEKIVGALKAGGFLMDQPSEDTE